MKKPLALALAGLSLALGATVGSAQIRALNLTQMVDAADSGVHATITSSRVFRVDHPVDGPGLYYTSLTLEGEYLHDGRPVTLDVTFPGGFLNEREGCFNSEAPSADDCKVGNEVVAFLTWRNDMGGGVAGNALVASHGGLFRTVPGPSGATVLGRGEGYAVDRNIRAADLSRAVRRLHQEKLERLERERRPEKR